MATNTTEAIYNAMKGRDCLQNWDILVAYDEDTINKRLAASSDANKHILTGIEPVVWHQPKMGPNAAVDYTLTIQLQTPSLSFKDAEGTVDLTFPVTGSTVAHYAVTPAVTDDKSELPKGISLSVTAKLVNVTGKKADATTSSVTPSKDICVFEPGTDSVSHIAIDFSQVTPLLVGADQAVKDTTDWLNTMAMPRLKLAFTDAKKIEYSLAQLSNSKDTTASPGDLVPHEFCFTTITAYKEKDGTKELTVPGALLTWISVVGNKRGNANTTNSPLLFRPDETLPQFSPIPRSHTASVLFSHELMRTKLWEPGFVAAKCESVTTTSKKNDEGMIFTMKLDKTKKVELKKFDDGKPADKYQAEYDWYWTSGFDFNMDAETTTVTISKTPGFVFKHTINNIEFGYEHKDQYKIRPYTIKAQLDLDLESKTCSLTWTASDDNDIKFSLKPQEIFSPSKRPHDLSGWDKVKGYDRVKAKNLDDLKLGIPEMTFTNSLKYFLTTNILFPGQTVFKADLSATGGLFIPRDTLLVGNVTTFVPAPPPKPDTPKPANLLATALTSLFVDNEPRDHVVARFHAKLCAKDSDLLGSIMNALASEDGTMVQKVLDAHSFGDLTAADFGKKTGVKSVQDLMPKHPFSLPVRSLALLYYDAVSTFQVKDYGAVYKITVPARDTASYIYVNPITGMISVDKSTPVKPTITPQADGTNLVSWAAGDDTYQDALFTSNVDVVTTSFNLKIKGKRTSSGTTVDFEAEQYVPKTEEDEGDGPPVATTWDRFVSVSTVIAFGIAPMGVFFGIQAWYWKRKADQSALKADEKKQVDAFESIARERNVVRMEKLLKGVETIAIQTTTKQLSDRTKKNIREQIEKTMRNKFNEKLGSISIHNIDPASPDPITQNAIDDAQAAGEAEVADEMSTSHGPDVVNALSHFEKSGFLDASRAQKIKVNVLQSCSQDVVDKMKQNTPDGSPSWQAEFTKTLIYERKISDLKKEKATAATNIVNLQQNEVAEQGKLTAELNKKKEKEKLLNPNDPDGQAELKAEIHEIDGDIQKYTKDHHDAYESLLKEQKRELSLDSEHDAAENEHKQSEKAAEKGFEHVVR